MIFLTPEQELIKQAVLKKVTRLLADNNPKGVYLLKSSQVIQILNISQRMLYRLRASGVLPAKRIASCYRYEYQDVLNILQQNSSSKPLTLKQSN
ncbi:helix-turn-helix domain-containing protein [uncultured Chitinophaga sp.]|jgi:hypothetical protein|uniref:helix-turn-helix domain-containing protein n=1 Tax=uncultured Chitinophaga sp. TaxID=339340 RepID=UPI00345291A4